MKLLSRFIAECQALLEKHGDHPVHDGDEYHSFGPPVIGFDPARDPDPPAHPGRLAEFYITGGFDDE